MKLVIFGQPQKWDEAVDMIVKYGTDITVCGLSYYDITPFADNDAVLSAEEAGQLCKEGIIDGILQVNAENPYYFLLLEQLEIRNIYVIPQELYFRKRMGEDLSGERIVYRREEVLPELWQIEFQLADHCNLNCKGCTHFSNLVPEPVFADKAAFAKDLAQLRSYFSYLHYFYLMGGEPLLNAELGDYIRLIRETFPYTQIVIVTNGLLICTLKEEVLKIIAENNAQISISDYSCLEKEKIDRFLGAYGIVPEFRGGKENFGKHINLKGDSDPERTFYQCPSRHCTFLGKGKISACCQPLTAHYFNAYFHENLPEDEGIDLYDPDMNGWEAARRLFTPMESCRYCTDDVSFAWEIARPPFRKEDWCAKTE